VYEDVIEELGDALVAAERLARAVEIAVLHCVRAPNPLNVTRYRYVT
jgi:hypothetical protein